MSSDQRPGKIKIVQATPVSARAAGNQKNTASGNSASQTTAASDTENAEQPQKSGMLNAILFFVGCGVGGALLVAWPHIGG